MTQSFTSDSLQALAVYPFQTPDWKNKFLIGSLVVFASYIIPIIPLLALYGYAAQIMRRIIVENGEPFLPEWDDWGKLMTDGLKLLGAGLVYSLPGLILLCGGYAMMFGMVFSTSLWAESGDEILPGLMGLFGSLGFFACFGLGMVLFLVAYIFLPPAVGHLIATDQFGAAFRWQEWWPIFRANLSGFLISYALLMGFWFVLSFALQILYFTIIGCCLLPFILPPVTIYMTLIGSSLFAQAYRIGLERLPITSVG